MTCLYTILYLNAECFKRMMSEKTYNLCANRCCTTLHVYTCSAVKYYVWAQGNKSYFHEAALNSVSVDNEYVHSTACCSPLLFIKMSVIRPADCSKLPDAKCCRISTCCYEYCQSCLCQGPAVSCVSRTSCILCVKDQLYPVCQGPAVSCVIDHLYLVCHRPAVSWVTDHLYLVCHRPAVSCPEPTTAANKNPLLQSENAMVEIKVPRAVLF